MPIDGLKVTGRVEGLAARIMLLVAAVACMPLLAGCGWVTLTAATGVGYETTAKSTTDDFTKLAFIEGSMYVDKAVKVWMDRGQLPLPLDAMADGVHDFSIRSTTSVNVKGSLGARAVELWDRNRLVAEYVVAWDRQPEQYRLVSAQNKLYGGELDVSAVPVLQTNFVE
jgi:hypothetical protein